MVELSAPWDRPSQAWAEGKLIILATLAEGPNAGHQVVCVASRSGLKRGIKRSVAKLSWLDRGFMHSLSSAIQAEVRRGITHLNSTNDQNFMDDLTIMMAVRLASRSESVLDGSGLFSLFLAVNPDESAPWTNRGLLSAADIHAPIQDL